MEGATELYSCSFEDREYVHGERVCAAGKCLICSSGKWVEDDTLFVL